MLYPDSFGEVTDRCEKIPVFHLHDGGTLRVMQLDHHRNGSGGDSHWNAITRWRDGNGDVRTMLIVAFLEEDNRPTKVAAFDLELLANQEIGIAFGLNSWRSADAFGEAMATFVADHRFLYDLEHYGEDFAREFIDPRCRVATK